MKKKSSQHCLAPDFRFKRDFLVIFFPGTANNSSCYKKSYPLKIFDFILFVEEHLKSTCLSKRSKFDDEKIYFRFDFREKRILDLIWFRWKYHFLHEIFLFIINFKCHFWVYLSRRLQYNSDIALLILIFTDFLGGSDFLPRKPIFSGNQNENQKSKTGKLFIEFATFWQAGWF